MPGHLLAGLTHDVGPAGVNGSGHMLRRRRSDGIGETREFAEHFWPPKPKAERITPSVALSRSAFSVTIVGFLPPISQITGLGTSVEKCL